MSKLLENLFEEPERGMLVYIPTDRIDPHPDNPRKDLGDLTELADSIKQNGILQNLTVVPQEDGRYRALIGHRRLAAAQLAGLTEVPCVIVEMDYREQLQTMLQENMQRSDLTVYEQAKGFQMMLDLGETVESLAATSGFSQSTIRRRVKLLDLDEKAFKKSVERGATLADYAELDKIEDPVRKNRVLAVIGTPDFRMWLKTELESEQRERNQKKWREILSAFATEVDNVYDYRTEKCWGRNEAPKNVERPEGEGDYYFHISSWGGVYLLTDKPKQAEETEDQRRQRELEERNRVRVERLREASNRAFELRAEFAADVSIQTVKEHWAEIAATWICLCTMVGCGTGTTVGIDEIEDQFLLERVEYAPDRKWAPYAECLAAVDRQPEWTLWLMVWMSIGDSETNRYIDWNNEHRINKPLDVLYDLLAVMGYEMSEEEKQLQDGTHPLFQKEV